MALLDKNDFFYTALRVAVAQDKNPDWIFKTNLLHIDNVAQKIYSDNLIRPNIDLNSVYEYIDTTTPFHTRFENYAIQYTKNDEEFNVIFDENRTMTIELGYQNVSEYPTTVGYDSLPYDFEYPGLGNGGSDYISDDENYSYQENFGFTDILQRPDPEDQLSGWYAFKNPLPANKRDRNRCIRGSFQEDPVCGAYDYQPTEREFDTVLNVYNKHNHTNLSKRDLLIKYYKDPYYYDITANYLYILNQDRTFDWVRDKLNNGYRGLQVKGGKIDDDANGYESSQYDYELYDYITYENKYFINNVQGSVSTYSELPSNLTVLDSGKYYNVISEHSYYYWDGYRWNPDSCMEEEDRFNTNKVVPVSTSKFAIPDAPFQTKKINVYFSELQKKQYFNCIGHAYEENAILKNYNDSVSYGAFREFFKTYTYPWEIEFELNIKNFMPVSHLYVTDQETGEWIDPETGTVVDESHAVPAQLFTQKVITILGNKYNKFSIPQVYMIGTTIYMNISTNGSSYDIQTHIDNVNIGQNHSIRVGYTYDLHEATLAPINKRFYLAVDNEISEIPVGQQIYDENSSTLRLGDSVYKQQDVNFVPIHFTGGIFEYKNDYIRYQEPVGGEGNGRILIPQLKVIYPIPKTVLDREETVSTMADLATLSPAPINGTNVWVDEISHKFVYYDNNWYRYDDSEDDSDYIQQVAIRDIYGSVRVVTLLTAVEISNILEPLPRENNRRPVQVFVQNRTTSQWDIPDGFTKGLLVYDHGTITGITDAIYMGKRRTNPEEHEITSYPAYYFDTGIDGFRYIDPSNGVFDWTIITEFTILATLTKNNNTVVITNINLFENNPDIRYLFQDSTIDLNTFKFIIDGQNQLQDVRIEKYLKLNRDYQLLLDDDGKQYVEVYENDELKQFKSGSILRIDCLDYDYLYDLMIVNRTNKDNEFSSYRRYLGSYASVEDLFRQRGRIKIKNHDYFFNTTTNTVWVLELVGQHIEITQDFSVYDLEIILTEENYLQEIYEVLGFQFGWFDTGESLATIQKTDKDLFLLTGTRMRRPEYAPRGSEEIRTGIRDGVIIDVIEDISYINNDDLKLSPKVTLKSIPEGQNQQIETDIFNSDSVISFRNGKYTPVSLRWKSKTVKQPLPNDPLHPLVDISALGTQFIEIEKDNANIIFSQMFYGQTEHTFEVETGVNDIHYDQIVLTFDGTVLKLQTDYTVTINEDKLTFTIRDNFYQPNKKYCYGVYIVKADEFSIVYNTNLPRLPYEVPYPDAYGNISDINNFVLFNNEGKKVLPPYMKWYYLTEPTNQLELPCRLLSDLFPSYVENIDPTLDETIIEAIKQANQDIIDTNVSVYIGSGNNLKNVLKVQSSEFIIQENKIIFNSNIPANLTVGILIKTENGYTVRITYKNNLGIVDYSLAFIIDYFENQIVDYGSENRRGDAIINIIGNNNILHAKTLVYVSNARSYNFRCDVYERRLSDEYEISNIKFDKNSICVWKNGTLLESNLYEIVGNKIKLKTLTNSMEDIIQIWYKLNTSIKAYEHNKFVITDTNKLYSLYNLPKSQTRLVSPFGWNDVKMYVDNANYLTQPYIDERNITAGKPGRIQIGNEILEFWSINYNDTIPSTEIKCHSLSGFVRNIYGSSAVSDKLNGLDNKYPVGTTIQDIGHRYETLKDYTKNKDSQINYTVVDQNWLDETDNHEDFHKFDSPYEEEYVHYNEPVRDETMLLKLHTLYPNPENNTEVVIGSQTYLYQNGAWYLEYTQIQTMDTGPISEEEQKIKTLEEEKKHIIMTPWYNIPGTAQNESDIKVWKTELITVTENYNPEEEAILAIDSDKSIDNIPSYIFKSEPGNYTFDYNSLTTYNHMYYRSTFVNDIINIELFNEVESLYYTDIAINGSLEAVAQQINSVVDTNILSCKSITDIIDEQTVMQFTLKNGYSMRIVENDTDQSFFIQELFGGIQKSTNGDVLEQPIEILEDDSHEIVSQIDLTVGTSTYTYKLKYPEGGMSTIELLVSDLNADFNKTKVWFAIKENTQIGNIKQLNVVNYNKFPIYIEDMSPSGDLLATLGLKVETIGCPVIDENNENGELVINNPNDGKIVLNEHYYEFDSIKYLDDTVYLIGIHIPFEISAGTKYMGSKLILQVLNKDYYIEYNNRIKFYERLPLGTLIRIQNKDIIIDSDLDNYHNHNYQ